MPAYLDEKHLSNDIRQYNDERVRCRVGGTDGLEIFLEGWVSFDIEQVGCKTGRENMDRKKDPFTIGRADITILDQEVL